MAEINIDPRLGNARMQFRVPDRLEEAGAGRIFPYSIQLDSTGLTPKRLKILLSKNKLVSMHLSASLGQIAYVDHPFMQAGPFLIKSPRPICDHPRDLWMQLVVALDRIDINEALLANVPEEELTSFRKDMERAFGIKRGRFGLKWLNARVTALDYEAKYLESHKGVDQRIRALILRKRNIRQYVRDTEINYKKKRRKSGGMERIEVLEPIEVISR